MADYSRSEEDRSAREEYERHNPPPPQTQEEEGETSSIPTGPSNPGNADQQQPKFTPRPSNGNGNAPRKPAAYASAIPTPSNVLGVFGLSIKTTENDLQEEFGKCGPVEKVVVVYDQRSERSRGFGFVTMREQVDAEKCIAELNGMELHGRRLRVDFSMTTRPHQSTPGEYRGARKEDDYTQGRSSYSGGGGGGYRGDRGGGGRGSYGGSSYPRREESSRRDDRGERYSSSRDEHRDSHRDRDRDGHRSRDERDRGGERRREDYYSSSRRSRSRSPPRRRRSYSPGSPRVREEGREGRD